MLPVKNSGDIYFYTYFNISIINSFICLKKSKSIHARYSLVSYKNAQIRYKYIL